MRLDPSFQPLLEAFDLEALDSREASVCGIWADGRLAYANAGWDRFAKENGAPDLAEEWPLGRDIFEAIAPALLPFYREAWHQVEVSGHPWTHPYECSSHDEFRLFQMTVYRLPFGLPFPETEVECLGFLCVHSRLRSQPWPTLSPERPAMEAEYRDSEGLITQCAHCRRVERQAGSPGTWDSVATWVEAPPPGTTHGLCDICAAYHYFSRFGLPDA